MNQETTSYRTIIAAKREPALLVHQKSKTSKAKLLVVFVSLGVCEEKGCAQFERFAKEYGEKHPGEASFLGIGFVPPSPYYDVIDAMPQSELTLFYRSHVDIYMNFELTDRKHGWPLGVEAMVAGAVMFTFDIHDLNEKNGYEFGQEMFIINKRNFTPAIQRLHKYFIDRELLWQHSVISQRRVFSKFGFEQQAGHITNLITRYLGVE